MRTPLRLAGILVVITGLVASAESLPVPAEALHRVIIPSSDEVAWQEIPWTIDLLEARRTAAREGKPIFLWQMDGHPLGCT